MGLYIRNIIFGITDSLVSTVGLLSGINIIGTPRKTIILTGIIYAFVEGFSMAVGSFLSEQSAEEYEAKRETPSHLPFLGGVIMFISFVLVSFIPIIPYYFFYGTNSALIYSVIFSLAALFAAGLISAKVSRIKLFKQAVRMVFLGGAAIVVGIIVGKFINVG